MAKVSFIISGDKELIAALKKSETAALAAMKRAAHAGAEIIRAEVERNAPVDEGDLSHGFETKAGSKKKGGANAVVTIKRRELEYAFYQEFGAPNRKRGGTLPARPFIRPAFDSKKRAAQEELIRALKATLGL